MEITEQGRVDGGAVAARAAGVWKVYGSGASEVVALRQVDVDIAAAGSRPSPAIDHGALR